MSGLALGEVVGDRGMLTLGEMSIHVWQALEIFFWTWRFGLGKGLCPEMRVEGLMFFMHVEMALEWTGKTQAL